MLSPCTKTLSMVVEFHSITGIVCAVNSADKLMKEHCFPRDWPLKPSWPWWILPRESKDMMYCSYHEFSVKEELLEAKPPSIEGSVVEGHAHLSHFRAHIIYGWQNADRQTNGQTNAKFKLTNRDLVGYT